VINFCCPSKEMKKKRNKNLHRTIVTDVIVKIFWMFDGRSSSRALSGSRPFVWSVRAFGETASDFVCRRPHHLRVMADLEKIVLRRAVRKIVFFQEPRFGGKHPNFSNKKKRHSIIALLFLSMN
jgi:hypothetical protein